MQPEVIVHHLAQATEVLRVADERGVGVQLRSAPHAACAAGVGYLQSLSKAIDHEILIDCVDDPALVMAALRAGCRRLIFSGPEADRRRLGQMAARYGAAVLGTSDRSSPCLVLSPDDDGTAIHGWLEDQQRP